MNERDNEAVSAKRYSCYLGEVLNGIDEMYEMGTQWYYEGCIVDKEDGGLNVPYLSAYHHLYYLLAKLAIKHNIPPNYHLPHRSHREFDRVLTIYHQTAPEPILIKRYQAYLGALVAALKAGKAEATTAAALANANKDSVKFDFFTGLRLGYYFILSGFHNQALPFQVPVEGLVTQEDIDHENSPLLDL